MRIISLIAVGVTLAAPPALYGMTLEEALIHSYHSNTTLLSERAQLRKVDEDQVSALSGLLPTINATSSQSRTKFDFDGGPQIEGVSSQQALTITQPLFSGGRTYAAIQQASFNVKSGQASLENNEQDILFKTVQAYVSLREQLEILSTSENNLKVLKHHYDSATERLRLGDATKTEMSQARARYALAESEYVQAQSNVEAARAQFISVVTVEPDILEEVRPAPIEYTALEDVIEVATLNHPALIAADMRQRATEYATLSAKGALLPSINAVGRWSRTGHSLPGSSQGIDRTGSIQVSVPLYQGGAEYATIRKARHDERINALQKETTHSELRARVTGLWYQLMADKESIRATQNAIEAASFALDGVTEEAKLGTRPLLDVLDAEQELFNSRVQHIRAFHKQVLNSYSMYAAMGYLTAEDLSLPTTYYRPSDYADNTKWKLIGWQLEDSTAGQK